MSDEHAAVWQPAPAKINLYLHVLGRRDNGYHELDSLVMFAGAGDRLELRPADRLSLAITGRFGAGLQDEALEGNLVWRAAVSLGRRFGRTPAVALRLTKELPVASGIGGGSADAAACLRALAQLWGIPADDPALAEVALGLGADVPVCLAGRATFFGGIGELLDPAPALPDCPAVLVNPGVPLPTPAVFKARRGPFSAPGRFREAPADAATLAQWLGQRHNDLTAPAVTLAPVVAEVLQALAASAGCLLARLSGSGATCFGLYPDPAQAAAAAAALSADHPDWWIAPTTLTGAAH